MDAGERPQFSRTRYAPGYRISDVDAFIDRIEATLGLRPRYGPPVTATDVARVQFRLVRFRRGYEPREVDHALDRYEELLAERGWP
jgi:DivIVA domain-containing protein